MICLIVACPELVERAEMIAVQGKPADIAGYYQPDDAKGQRHFAPAGRSLRGSRQSKPLGT
jgi:monomeric isocitrate dehydrogenase